MNNIRGLLQQYRYEIQTWRNEKKSLVVGLILGSFVAWLFYNHWIFLIPLLPCLFPWMKWQKRKKKRIGKLGLQKDFKEMMISISNSLSAGYSFENAMTIAHKELEEGTVLEKELKQFLMEIEVNEPTQKALMDMANRVKLEELGQFCEIVCIVKKNGGNLIEIVGKTVDQINQSLQLKEEIATMTAAKRMEKQIMSVMPFFILGYVRFSNPGYFDVLYSNLLGRILATVALALLVMANLWAERVVQIDI